jgi:O-antigen ligase
VPAAVYAIHKAHVSSIKSAFIYMCMFVAIGFGEFLSFSRGGMMNFAISISLYAFFSFAAARSIQERLRWLLFGPLVACLLLGLGVASISNSNIGSNFQNRAKLVHSYDVEEGGRFDALAYAVQAAATDPIGVGPGLIHEEFGLPPHNLSVHVLVESGWVGTLAFYAFIFLTLWNCLLLVVKPVYFRRENFVVLACLIGTLTQSVFIDSTHWRHLWFLFALAWIPVIESNRQTARSRSGIMSNSVR